MQNINIHDIELVWEPVFFAMPVTNENHNLHGLSVNVKGNNDLKFFLMKKCNGIINYENEISEELINDIVIV